MKSAYNAAHSSDQTSNNDKPPQLMYIQSPLLMVYEIDTQQNEWGRIGKTYQQILSPECGVSILWKLLARPRLHFSRLFSEFKFENQTYSPFLSSFLGHVLPVINLFSYFYVKEICIITIIFDQFGNDQKYNQYHIIEQDNMLKSSRKIIRKCGMILVYIRFRIYWIS